MGKEIDPSDIGKHPSVIKMAQTEMMQTDVLVCGRCHSVFHFTEMFMEHKEIGCKSETSLKDCRETKSKVWAFLLWKASQLNSEENTNVNSWKLYQTWVKMDEVNRETWVVAGKTIQSFARMGQGNLQEMPVKITKTVVDSTPDSSPDTKINKLVRRGIEVRQVSKLGIIKNQTEHEEKSQTDESEDDTETSRKSEPAQQKTIMDNSKVKRPIGRATTAIKPQQITVAPNRTKPQSYFAKRTIRVNQTERFEESAVEKILAKRFNPRRNQPEFLVKWENIVHEQNTWEPMSHLQQCHPLIENFEKQLAKQKEQRAAAALLLKNQVKPEPVAPPPPELPSPRPLRNSKARALDQVKQWCADEEASSQANKRPTDDSDFDEFDNEDDDETFKPKRLRTEQPIVTTPASLKLVSQPGIRIVQMNKSPATPQQSIVSGKTLNGASATSKMDLIGADKLSPDVYITKDGRKATGVVRKPGVPLVMQPRNEAQVRVVSKGEANSGVIRITSNSNAVGLQKLNPRIANASPMRATALVRPSPPGSGGTTLNRPIAASAAVRTGGASPQINRAPLRSSTGATLAPIRPATGVNPRRIAPAVNPTITTNTVVQQKPTITRITRPPGKPIVNVVEQPRVKQQQVAQQKITRRIVQPISKPEVHDDDDFDDELDDEDPFPSDLPIPEPASPPRPMTLCPVTGKVLGQAEGEPTPSASPEPPMASMNAKKEQREIIPSSEIKKENKSEPMMNTVEQEGLTITTEDGQVQQLLTNEDGSPLLVTGDDGTIYQVAGKNAEGQTLLIAQGADGEQQCMYVAADDSEDGGNSVLTLDGAVAEAVAQMMPEQMETEGGDATQPLTIATDSDSQDGQITAEVVQAELPSPGGTRRVVLLLPDGTFMMTEVNEEQYQQLNLVS